MLYLSQDTVQGILSVMGTEYPKPGEDIQRSEDLVKLLNDLPWINFEGFVKLVLLSRGSKEVPSISCNTAGKYVEVDADFVKLVEEWDEKLVPQISKWLDAEDPVSALVEGIAGVLMDPHMKKEDHVVVFTHILSSGLCKFVQLRNEFVYLEKEIEKTLDVLSFLESFDFDGTLVGSGRMSFWILWREVQ